MQVHRLHADVHVARDVDTVRGFFSDPDSLVRWDRSVSKVIPTTDGPVRPGYTFSTLGPASRAGAGKRSDYLVRSCGTDVSEVELVNSRVFESAVWTLRLAAEERGTRVDCEVSMVLRMRFALVGWLLRLNAHALSTDLYFLKRAIEEGETAKR